MAGSAAARSASSALSQPVPAPPTNSPPPQPPPLPPECVYKTLQQIQNLALDERKLDPDGNELGTLSVVFSQGYYEGHDLLISTATKATRPASLSAAIPITKPAPIPPSDQPAQSQPGASASSAPTLKAPLVEKLFQATTISEDPSTRYLQVNDPAATLLRCEDHTFPAIVQVCSIKVDGHSRLALAASQAAASTVAVKCQILSLVRKFQTQMVRMTSATGKRTALRLVGSSDVNGRILECIDHATATSTACGKSCAAVLHERFAQLRNVSVPSVTRSAEYPYTYNDRACFACETEVGKSLGLLKNGCELCGTSLPTFKSPQRNLSHMAAHILFDPALKNTHDACGFCLQPNNLCSCTRESMCPKKPTRFSYQAAASSTKSSPSSNVPIRCLLCPQRAATVWHYNLRRHLELAHECDPEQYKELWHISGAEKYALQQLWDKVKTTIQRPRQKTIQPSISLSVGHTSRLLMRQNNRSRLESHGRRNSDENTFATAEADTESSTTDSEPDDDTTDDEPLVREDSQRVAEESIADRGAGDDNTNPALAIGTTARDNPPPITETRNATASTVAYSSPPAPKVVV
ncbi:hypothetical protein EXIGLDRAFT_767328 [Exidia glandulosa HHB12029]|uniref:Uncharacterized protein n=1 Tax=Exidia glandulosa HHB12029 TaxID=1314781 RepID=A0A165J386_EXIGL|nr:hypothetical protein EXIGLDRAFT_767328 [Exidia glandulosa HHB12029]